MSATASQITCVSSVCLTVYADIDQRKHQSTASLTGLFEGNPIVSGGSPSQTTKDAENVSIWWRHHYNMKVSTGKGFIVSDIKQLDQLYITSIPFNITGVPMNKDIYFLMKMRRLFLLNYLDLRLWWTFPCSRFAYIITFNLTSKSQWAKMVLYAWSGEVCYYFAGTEMTDLHW